MIIITKLCSESVYLVMSNKKEIRNGGKYHQKFEFVLREARSDDFKYFQEWVNLS